MRQPLLRTIKAKMALVIAVIIAILVAVDLLASVRLYRNYRRLLLARSQSLLSFEKERTDKDIRRLEDNVRELALFGEVLHAAARDNDFDALGRETVVRNFQVDTLAFGGGIWFEPGAAFPDRDLVAFYAHNDNGRIRYNPHYATPEYNYPAQPWYTRIRERIAATGRNVAWTEPYVDDETGQLMTTGGSLVRGEDDTVVGMATIDWRLEDIARTIAAIRPTPGSFVLFASPENDIVLANSDPNPDPNRQDGDRSPSLADVPWFHADTPSGETLEYADTRYYSFRTAFDNGMLLVLNIPKPEMEADLNRTVTRLILWLAGAGLLMAAVVHRMLDRFINRPVAYLSEKAGDIGRGNLDADIRLPSGDELGRLGGTLADMAQNLKTHIRDLGAATAEKERIGAELDIARNIQASMLPSVFPPFPERREFDIAAVMTPAREVGGDFYDFFLIDDDRVAVVIADVSGKGVPAALFMVTARTHIRNHAMLHLPPADVFSRVNSQLCENNRMGMFVTAFMGVLDVRTGGFDYVNAGHNPPVAFTESGAAFLPVRRGFVLGGVDGIGYTPEHTTLRPGDSLLLYTDGVTEAENADGEFFSAPRLLASAGEWQSARAGIGDLPGRVKRDVDRFAGAAPQADDLTMLALAYYGNGDGGPA